MTKQEEKIVICENCDGTGYLKDGRDCPECQTKGRVLRQITIIDSPIDEENLKRKALYG